MIESCCTYLKATVKLVKGWFACMAVLCFTVALPGLSLSSGDSIEKINWNHPLPRPFSQDHQTCPRPSWAVGNHRSMSSCCCRAADGQIPLYMMLKIGRDNKEKEEGQETRRTSWCQWQWLSMRKQDGQGRNIWHLQHRWASSFRWIFTCENTLKRSFFFQMNMFSYDFHFLIFFDFILLWDCLNNLNQFPSFFRTLSFPVSASKPAAFNSATCLTWHGFSTGRGCSKAQSGKFCLSNTFDKYLGEGEWRGSNGIQLGF